MASKSRIAARNAQAQESMAADIHNMAEQQTLMFEWLAGVMVVVDERLQAIEEANGIKYVPPLPDDVDSDTPEPDKPKRGRPRKEKANA